MAREDLKPGEAIDRNSSGGRSIGTTVKPMTSRTVIKKDKVGGSEDDPEYIVKSKSSGRIAARENVFRKGR